MSYAKRRDSFGASRKADEHKRVLRKNENAGFLHDEFTSFLRDETISRHVGNVTKKKFYLPVKIKMIYTSWKAGSTNITLFGYNVEIVKLIGYITASKSTPLETSFMIDDGTGTINCVFLYPPTCTIWKKTRMHCLGQTESLVKIYGEFNPLYTAKAPTIMIYDIRQVRSAKEVKLHELDVIHSILSIDGKNGPIATETLKDMDNVLKEYNIVSNTNSPDRTHSFQQTSVSGPSTNTLNIPANEASLTKFISCTLSIELKRENLNGLHITELLRRCKRQHSFSSIEEHHLKLLLGKMEKDALVYQTLDSDTYASSEG